MRVTVGILSGRNAREIQRIGLRLQIPRSRRECVSQKHRRLTQEMCPLPNQVNAEYGNKNPDQVLVGQHPHRRGKERIARRHEEQLNRKPGFLLFFLFFLFSFLLKTSSPVVYHKQTRLRREVRSSRPPSRRSRDVSPPWQPCPPTPQLLRLPRLLVLLLLRPQRLGEEELQRGNVEPVVHRHRRHDG